MKQNLTEFCRAEMAKSNNWKPVSDRTESIPHVNDQIVAERLQKAFAVRTPEQIAVLSWTDRCKLAQGIDVPIKPNE